MKLLSLDPSSTCCGYAVRDDGKLIDGGLLRPDKPKADVVARCRSMRMQAHSLIMEIWPNIILIEGMIEKQHTRSHERTTGLPVCGWGMGYLAGAIDMAIECPINPVGGPPVVYVIGNQEWTKGLPKDQRPTIAHSEHANYDPAKDPGGDVADAILMAEFWMKRKHEPNLRQLV